MLYHERRTLQLGPLMTFWGVFLAPRMMAMAAESHCWRMMKVSTLLTFWRFILKTSWPAPNSASRAQNVFSTSPRRTTIWCIFITTWKPHCVHAVQMAAFWILPSLRRKWQKTLQGGRVGSLAQFIQRQLHCEWRRNGWSWPNCFGTKRPEHAVSMLQLYIEKVLNSWRQVQLVEKKQACQEDINRFWSKLHVTTGASRIIEAGHAQFIRMQSHFEHCFLVTYKYDHRKSIPNHRLSIYIYRSMKADGFEWTCEMYIYIYIGI